LHHAEPKLFFDLIHMFELFEFELSSLEKIKRKAIGNSEKKENCISAQLAQSSPTGGSTYQWRFPRLHALFPLPLPSGAGLSVLVVLARAPVFSFCLTGPTCQHTEPFHPRGRFPSLRHEASLSAPPSLRTAMDQHTHPPRTPATSPAHSPSSLLRTACTRSLSPASFRTHYVSRSTLVARARQRPTPVVPALQPTIRSAKPPQAMSRAWFSLFAPDLSQFGLAGVHPLSARWLADSTSHRAPTLVHSFPLPLPELARALAHPIPPPHSRDSSPEFPRSVRSFPSAVLSSVVSVSCPELHQRVCRVLLADPGQLR
jgi:hypothetical protein